MSSSPPVTIDSSKLCSLEAFFRARSVVGRRQRWMPSYQQSYQTARTRLLRHCGLCVACGKAEAQPGRTRCRRCALYASERTKKWLRKRRLRYAASPNLECLLTAFQRLGHSRGRNLCNIATQNTSIRGLEYKGSYHLLQRKETAVAEKATEGGIRVALA